MSLVKYRALVNVVDLGSLTLAAKEMGYSQPGISHMITSLENEMGIQLVTKTKNAIVPTVEGLAVIECCRKIIEYEDILNETVSSFHSLVSGELSISALHSMLLNVVPTLTNEFTNFYSGIDIVLREELYEKVPESLNNNDTDIAFTSNVSLLNGLDFIPLFEDELGIALSSQHPLASMDKVPISALNGYTIISGSIGCDDVYDKMQATCPFEPGKQYYIDSDVAALAMVSAKTGIRPISRLQEPNFPPGIVFRSLKEECYRTIGIAVKPSRKSTPVIKALIEFSKNNIDHYIHT